METIAEFNQIMTEQDIIALATSVDGLPNVRVVNFYYDEAQEGILFFSTMKNNRKVAEFFINHTVAFTTIPKQGNKHVRAIGKIRRSSLSIYDFQDVFEKKVPGYAEKIELYGDKLILFEIHFDSADVILDYRKKETIEF